MLALLTESWTWYAITWLVVIARVFSRKLLVGSFKKLQLEDFLMFVAMIADTVLIATMNIVADTSSNLIDPNDTTPLDAENIALREFGSKMVLVVEQMQCITIWLVKACLLLMYSHLTMNLKQRVAVKIVAGYAAAGFVIMEILYLGVWCRPFNQYWAVPPDNIQCSAATNHLITNLVLNISSDIMIMLIPMPILVKSSLPLKKKLVLGGIFLLGSFTILSALLSKYYSFTEPFGSAWTFWYIRESSTALITANLPATWTLIRHRFHLSSFNAKSSQRTGPNISSGFRSGYPNNRHGSRLHSTAGRGDEDAMELGATDSQEQINKTYMMPLQIYKQQEVQVEVHVGGTKAGSVQDSDSSSNGRGGEGPAGRPQLAPKISFKDKNGHQEGPSADGRDGIVTTIAGGR
ncbi:uncharacterized protein B0I36DRAFT_411099 [Microdochium trichocladiopsis]|uniref:Rhodopsin domain-containing protein n=1 Tax=Microdochium trichocladiopsis TaxID=1682393 RepID=A0A9P8Y2J1_9PEZI|nr:uncharacterized protein B0I36DRAFT_411099 [Microdochium trichocladiopsis]KAH7029264.1 hypothetical protein B0I36DRAFT_411099 [Microdochium trichocladiopsis]